MLILWNCKENENGLVGHTWTGPTDCGQNHPLSRQGCWRKNQLRRIPAGGWGAGFGFRHHKNSHSRPSKNLAKQPMIPPNTPTHTKYSKSKKQPDEVMVQTQRPWLLNQWIIISSSAMISLRLNSRIKESPPTKITKTNKHLSKTTSTIKKDHW